MSENLKVFGVMVMSHADWPTTSGQPRVVVAAKSRAAAVRAFREVSSSMTDGFLKTFGGETGNPVEVAAAMSEPGTVFVASTDDYSAQEYVPLRPEAS